VFIEPAIGALAYPMLRAYERCGGSGL